MSSGINLDNNVFWVVMVLLSFGWSLASIELPVDTVGKGIVAGKVAVFFRAAALPWVAAAFWIVTGILTAGVNMATDASGNVIGFAIPYTSWLFYGVGAVEIVMGFFHGLLWDYPGEELTEQKGGLLN